MHLTFLSCALHKIPLASYSTTRPSITAGVPRDRQSFLIRSSRRKAPRPAATTGGGPDGGGGGAGDGGGKGGDGPGGDGGEGRFHWKGWEQRAAADPQFGFKVFCELVVGLTAMVMGDMSSRPNWGLSELDLVFATLVVGAVVNFSAVWVLAPTTPIAGAAAVTGGTAASQGLLQSLMGEKYLRAMGAPGSHMFQPGYGLAPRLLNLAYKSAVFSVIGMCAGVVGTALSNGLITLRKHLDPTFHTQSNSPTIMGNSLCWAIHMGASSNLRYQVINGLDMVLQPAMSSSLFRLYSFVLRIGNNVLGGMSFVMVARLLDAKKKKKQAQVQAADAEVAGFAASGLPEKAGWARVGH